MEKINMDDLDKELLTGKEKETTDAIVLMMVYCGINHLNEKTMDEFYKRIIFFYKTLGVMVKELKLDDIKKRNKLCVEVKPMTRLQFSKNINEFLWGEVESLMKTPKLRVVT